LDPTKNINIKNLRIADKKETSLSLKEWKVSSKWLGGVRKVKKKLVAVVFSVRSMFN